MYLPQLAPEHGIGVTAVKWHMRTKPKRGGISGVRKHRRRFLTTEDVAAGKGSGISSHALTSEAIATGLREGYAAIGPWEVERIGNVMTLLHYQFPIMRARFSDETGWMISKMQGRPGYGLSKSDRDAIQLTGRMLEGSWPTVPPIGLNPDPRLRTKKYGGSYVGGRMRGRVSPYASVDESRTASLSAAGLAWTSYSMGRRFPPRRGMKTR